MKHEPGIIDRRDQTPLAKAIAQVRLEYPAGRGVEHFVVSEWLKTWSQPDYKPFETWLFAWNG